MHSARFFVSSRNIEYHSYRDQQKIINALVHTLSKEIKMINTLTLIDAGGYTHLKIVDLKADRMKFIFL